jgi:hypothetical protein
LRKFLWRAARWRKNHRCLCAEPGSHSGISGCSIGFCSGVRTFNRRRS